MLRSRSAIPQARRIISTSSGVLICRSTSGVALTGFALSSDCQRCAVSQTHLLALKTERLQLFIGNHLIDDSGKRVRCVKQNPGLIVLFAACR
ncbi:hypothetical protein ACLB1T_02335 [Escherichia coli]